MKITTLAPVAVETVSADSEATLVVKASFRVGASVWGLADTALPLVDDVPAPGGPELYYARDRVPAKGRADVLVVGQAKSPAPVRAIAVRVAIGDVDKRCFACASAPATSVPLTSTYLRASPDGAGMVRVGPIAGGRADEEPYNAAPADQRASLLAPGAELVLAGLLAPGDVVSTHLPTWRPTAYRTEQRDASSGWERVALACDTLWIDVDRALAVLVWRGRMPAAGTAEIVVGGAERDLPVEALVASADPSAPETLSESTAAIDWEELTRDGSTLPFVRGSGTPPALSFAMTPPRAAGSTTAEETVAVTAVAFDALPFDVPKPDVPKPDVSKSDEPTGDAPLDLPTADVALDLPTADVALDVPTADVPKGDGAPASASAMPNLPETTLAVGAVAPGAALPFAPGRAPVRLVLPDDLGAEAQSGATREVPAAAIPAGDLPFGIRPRQPAVMPPRPLVPVLRDGVAPAPIAPAEPVAPAEPESARPSLTLETHAAVKAALLDGVALRLALAELGVDERSYRLAERRLAIDLAREAAQGGSDLSRRLDAAILDAQRNRVASEPPRIEEDLESYVMALAELEEADDVRAALRALGLDRDRWAAVRRAWTGRALVDPALSATLRERLAEARRALRRVAHERSNA